MWQSLSFSYTLYWTFTLAVTTICPDNAAAITISGWIIIILCSFEIGTMKLAYISVNATTNNKIFVYMLGYGNVEIVLFLPLTFYKQDVFKSIIKLYSFILTL